AGPAPRYKRFATPVLENRSAARLPRFCKSRGVMSRLLSYRKRCLFAVTLFALLAAAPLSATIAIDTSSTNDWKITNGVITLDWNSTSGNIFSVHLNGHLDELVDVTNRSSNGQPKGLYMDNTGLGGGVTTSGFQQAGDQYLDWWITVASSSTNAFTYT